MQGPAQWANAAWRTTQQPKMDDNFESTKDESLWLIFLHNLWFQRCGGARTKKRKHNFQGSGSENELLLMGK